MLNAIDLRLETAGEKHMGPCDCCGQMTSGVWGYVYEQDSALAAYFVEWTPGHQPRSAAFDLIIGRWGDDTISAERQAVALDFRHPETGPAFMVIDAGNRPVAKSTLVFYSFEARRGNRNNTRGKSLLNLRCYLPVRAAVEVLTLRVAAPHWNI